MGTFFLWFFAVIGMLVCLAALTAVLCGVILSSRIEKAEERD